MRLIDADALKKVIYFETNHLGIDFHKSKLIGIAIDNAPTIEAEPIRHGKWILTNKPNIYGGTTIKCSVCGYEGVIAHIEDHHYCWVCGAKMDEVEL